MRVPPTEKNGRVHTSSVSVALVQKPTKSIDIDKKDVKVEYTKGTGAGGQHKNKVETCVVLYHYPTQIRVMCQDSRSKTSNEEKAWKELEKRIEDYHNKKNNALVDKSRKSQIGIGGRLKKRRTYRVTDGEVKDHKTGKTIRFKDWEKGKVDKLH